MENESLEILPPDSWVGERLESNYSGEYEILQKAKNKTTNRRFYKIKFVETGYTKWERTEQVKKGKVKDPGNHNFISKSRKDETGKTYGRLKVDGFSHNVKGKHGSSSAHWRCTCECGEVVLVRGQSLREGLSTSCGCFQREVVKYANYRHGKYKTPEYQVHMSMLARCNNPNNTGYDDYGGRGIKVSERWQGRDGFENFVFDMGLRPSDKHTIERVDVNGGYNKENCVWLLGKYQSRNRRVNKNSRSGIKGVKQNGTKWFATISVGPRGASENIYLGTFDTKEAAMKARKDAEDKYFTYEDEDCK